MRVFKKVLAVVSIATMICAMPLTAGAVTTGITGTINNSTVSATYSYSIPGNLLRVEIKFTEVHSTTHQVYSDKCENSAAGSYTSVTKSRKADLGYKYTEMTAYGYLNYVIKAVLGPVEN